MAPISRSVSACTLFLLLSAAARVAKATEATNNPAHEGQSVEALCPCATNNADSICVRGAFPHNGKLVVLTEIPKEWVRETDATGKIYCSDGKTEATIENFGINHWTYKARSWLTHTFAKIKCPWSEDQRERLEDLVLTVKKYSNSTGPCKIPLRDTVHLPAATPQPYRFKLCAMTGVLFGEGNYVDEWLRHQQTIGVEHITAYAVVNANPEVDYAPFQPSSLFQWLVDTGYVTVVPWDPLLHGTQVYHRSQHLAYNDYLYRFRGLCEWTEFVDTDDFFVDFASGHNLMQIVERIEQTRPGQNSIRFCWQLFYPDCGRAPDVPLLDSMLYGRQNPSNTKHVSRTINMADTGIHGARQSAVHMCGRAEMWHVRHGFPAKSGAMSLMKEGTNCEKFRLPDDFYEKQAKKGYRRGRRLR